MTPQKLTQEELKTLEAQAASNDIAEIMSFNQHGEDNAIKLLAHIRTVEADLAAAQKTANDAIAELGRIHFDLNPNWAIDPGNVKLTGGNISRGIDKLRQDLDAARRECRAARKGLDDRGNYIGWYSVGPFSHLVSEYKAARAANPLPESQP